MRMSLMVSMLTACVVAAVIACANKRPIEPAALVGTYVLNRGQAPDLIALKPDGTYVHSYTAANGQKHSHQDRWSLEPINGEQRITFNEFVFALPGYGTGKPAFWNVEIERVGGSIRLRVDDDLGVWYQKQQPSPPTR